MRERKRHKKNRRTIFPHGARTKITLPDPQRKDHIAFVHSIYGVTGCLFLFLLLHLCPYPIYILGSPPYNKITGINIIYTPIKVLKAPSNGRCFIPCCGIKRAEIKSNI